MSAYPAYPPYDPSYLPPQAYYSQAYPPAHQPNGHPPHSPPGQPPARPHTTAPYPSASQFAPPPPHGGYYGTAPHPLPQPNGHAPPTPGSQPVMPSGGYPPPTPGSATSYDNMSPEQIQGMIDRLSDLKLNKSSPKQNEAGRSGALPPIVTSMAPPSSSQAPPQSARGPAPPSHGYPYPYPYPYPPPRPATASHNGEMSPPPTKGYPHHSSKPSLTMPGSFFPEAPAPPLASAPPTKTHAPGSTRPDPMRKASEQASEVSYSSSTKSHLDMSQAWEQWGGQLVEISPGREPRPKPKLVALYRGIAGYMIALLEPTQSCVVTLNKLIQFYSIFSVSDETDWQKFFQSRSPKVLSDLFCALNVEHHLVPQYKANQPPTIPGLTPRGFEVWMFTQLMTAPSREYQRITKILDRWTIFEQGVEMPKLIPRECFPQGKDNAIHQGWWQAVKEDFPEDLTDFDDERKVPLGLPEPEKRRKGFMNPQEIGGEEDMAKESPSAVPTALKKRTEKDSPSVERYRQHYGSTPNSGWREDRREDMNPRPILGEEPLPRPPTRAQSVKAPKTVKDGGSTRKNTKRGRSVHRKREESPDARYPSDDDYEDVKYDGYGKRYEADGLYEDPSPPSRNTTPYHHEPSSYPRNPRGISRPPPGKIEKDIREYTYQDQYEKEFATPQGGNRRPHRGSDAHSNRRSGQWRYASG